MSFPTRRGVLQGAAMALAAPRIFGQDTKITTSPLGDRLYLLTGAASNVVAFVDADQVVMVDGGLEKDAAPLAQAVAALPNAGAVKTLFNTHWHPEQVGSNASLAAKGATIIAHENTRLWLQQNITYPWNGQKFQKLPKASLPNKTFYDKGALSPRLQYGYISDAAHTDGDLYVFFPQQNVLAVGGAMAGAGWPMVDWWTGGWIGGIVGGLQRIQSIANQDTKIVGSTGPVLSHAQIGEQLDMYGAIFDKLNQGINKGRGPSEAVEAKVAKDFEAKMGNSDEFIRRSAESLWAYLSPDA